MTLTQLEKTDLADLLAPDALNSVRDREMALLRAFGTSDFLRDLRRQLSLDAGNPTAFATNLILLFASPYDGFDDFEGQASLFVFLKAVQTSVPSRSILARTLQTYLDKILPKPLSLPVTSPPALPTTTRLFISYSQQNRDFVERLTSDLEKAGFDLWWDKKLEGGDDWELRLREEIVHSTHVIPILTPEAVSSRWVRAEILLADYLRRPFHPVVLKSVQPPDMPLPLARAQWIDFSGGVVYESKLAELIASLR